MSDRDDHLNALFRASVEKQYGASMPDDVFRRGKGQYAHEPYYTAMATRFRDFVAGYEAARADASVGAVMNPGACQSCGLDWCGATCGRWPTGSVNAPPPAVAEQTEEPSSCNVCDGSGLISYGNGQYEECPSCG